MKTGRTFRDDALPVLLKAALLFFGVLGQLTQGEPGDFMSRSRWLYYTNQSNLIIMLVVAVLLVYDVLRLVRRDHAPVAPDALQTVRFVATVGVMLTFVVFSLLLTPEMLRNGQGAYLTTTSNICVHNLVPILAILDFCLFAWPWKTGGRTYLLGAIMPLAYVAFVYIGGPLGLTFGEGKRVPYFFFDYVANGWFSLGNGRFGTAYWLVILTLSVLGMGLLLIAIKNRVARKRATELL